MSEKITNLTAATFRDTISTATTPVLVDFWATWCGPCKAIAPILEELATEFDGRLKITKVDIEDSQNGNDTLAAEFDVRAIPTMLLFKNGKLADRVVGVLPKAALKAKLTPQLAVVA